MKKSLLLGLFAAIFAHGLVFANLVFAKSCTIGESLHGFCVTNSVAIEELSYHLTELEHEKSGARVVHIQAPDPENFFSIAFCTPNDSSNGVAHVLEHSVLQGSRKYPSNTLFYELTKNSLGSFINALTSCACTLYPGASAHESDFYNLLDVYCDAVFHPLLHPDVFHREGYRIEFLDDSLEKLTYKGIVYNEMNGANSVPSRRLYQKLTKALFPDTPLAHNYGGNTNELVGLSYETFVQFHKEHYYPGNAVFFFYGDIPLEKHLAFLEKLEALEGPKKEPKTLAKQKPNAQRVYQTHAYPATKDDGQTLMALGWVQDVQDTEELVALEVLDAILLQTDASILKSALIGSGLCNNAYGERDPTKTQVLYELILETPKSTDIRNVQALVFDTLQKVCREGIDQSLIENACQALLFEAYEPDREGKPSGFTLFSQCLRQKNLGLPVQEALFTHVLIEKVQEKTKNSPFFFSPLIKKHFLDNTHFAAISMQPSQELLKEERLQEESRLKTIAKQLTLEEKQEIVERAKRLNEEEAQNKKAPTFAKISLEAIPEEEKPVNMSQERVGAVDLFYHDTHRKGITSVDLVLHLPQIPLDEIWLFQLYADLLPEVGWGKRNAVENLQFIQKNIAGLKTSLAFVTDANNPLFTKGQLHICAKAFDHKQSELFSLFSDLDDTPAFALERVAELVHRYARSLQHQLNHLALGYAENTTLLGQSPYFYLVKESTGLGYFQRLQKLDNSFSTEGGDLCQKLTALHKKLVSNIRPHLLIACCKEAYSSAKTKVEGLFSGHAYAEPDFLQLKELPMQIEPTAFLTPSAVAYNAQGVQALCYRHPQSPYLALAATLCKNCLLVSSIRKQGGAYHADAFYNSSTGAFVLSSYRDPHIARTSGIFEGALETLSFDETDLHEAKISLIQRLDKPRKPFERLLQAYMHLSSKKTDEMRKSWRKSLLKATKEDVCKAIQEHLVVPFKKSVFITFAPFELIEAEKKSTLLPSITIQDIF